MSKGIGRAEKARIAEVLAAAPEVRLGILFGSLAQGAPRPDSDVDLAVMGDAPLSTEAKMALIEQLARCRRCRSKRQRFS